MVILVMGVAGAGKTTIGRRLADELGWQFSDGDDFHPAANIEKMRKGHALTDADRQPWLERMHAAIVDRISRDQPAVLACSVERNWAPRLPIVCDMLSTVSAVT